MQGLPFFYFLKLYFFNKYFADYKFIIALFTLHNIGLFKRHDTSLRHEMAKQPSLRVRRSIFCHQIAGQARNDVKFRLVGALQMILYNSLYI